MEIVIPFLIFDTFSRCFEKRGQFDQDVFVVTLDSQRTN
jgi:hypothetical protein